MDSVAPRVRTASAAASGYAMDFGDAFKPSKRAKIAPEEPEVAEIQPSIEAAPPGPSLMERLLLATATTTWQLSIERSVEQNEAFLNDQLKQAALLSSDKYSMPVDQARLPFAALLATIPGDTPASVVQRHTIEAHVRRAMDTVSWLLLSRQHEFRRHEELMERVRMADKDAERKQSQIQQLQLDVENLRQQMAQQENTFHAREHALMTERKTLLQDKRQLEVTCAKLQGQETAYKTQLRRKDVEYERLKKNLQDAVQRSAKEQRGMSMVKVLNGLTERKHAPAQRVSQSHEAVLTKRLIDNLERKRDELLFENEALAHNFETLQKQVESVSAQYKKAVQLFLAHRGGEGNTDETAALARLPIDDFTPTPLQLGVKANVASFIAQTVDTLSHRVRQFECAMQAELEFDASHPSEDLVNALTLKLDEAHAIIHEQDRLLQASLVAPVPAVAATVPSPGHYDKENIDINTGKQPVRAAPPPASVHSTRRRRVEHAILEQWADDVDAEWLAVRRKHRHVDDERRQLQTQAAALDTDRLAFEMRSFEHFFGRVRLEGDCEIDVSDVDCPASPRTAAYLESIGIRASVASN